MGSKFSFDLYTKVPIPLYQKRDASGSHPVTVGSSIQPMSFPDFVPIQEGMSLEFSEMSFCEEDNVRLKDGWAELVKLEDSTGFISKAIDIPGGDAD
jgi:hypothetical protein